MRNMSNTFNFIYINTNILKNYCNNLNKLIYTIYLYDNKKIILEFEIEPVYVNVYN